MGIQVERLGQELEIGFRGERPQLNGRQLGKNDLVGLAEYDADVNPQPASTESADVTNEAAPSGLTKLPNRQRFIRRHDKVEGRKRITRLPERHSGHYDFITGKRPVEMPHKIRIGSERYHVQEVIGVSDDKARRKRFATRPHIPSSRLKAPTIPSEDQDPQTQKDTQPRYIRSVKGQRPLSSQEIHIGTNGTLPFSELLRPESLRILKEFRPK